MAGGPDRADRVDGEDEVAGAVGKPMAVSAARTAAYASFLLPSPSKSSGVAAAFAESINDAAGSKLFHHATLAQIPGGLLDVNLDVSFVWQPA